MRFIGSLLTKVYFTEAIPNSADRDSDIATNTLANRTGLHWIFVNRFSLVIT